MKKILVFMIIAMFLTFAISAKEKEKEESKKKETGKEESTGKPWFGEPEYALLELGVGFFYHTYYFETKDDDAGDPAHIKYGRDLGYDDKYLHFTGDFIFRFKSIKLSLGYSMFNAETEHTINRDITFYDAIFDSDDDVQSTFNVHLLTLDFCWYILNLDLGKNFNVKLGPSIRIDAFITDIRLDGTGSDADKGDKFAIPVVPFPSLGISFETTIFKYSGLFFDINGMYAGKYLGYMNWKTGLRIYPWHWTGIELSYRHLYAEALWQGDLVKTDFHGFNMTFILRF